MNQLAELCQYESRLDEAMQADRHRLRGMIRRIRQGIEQRRPNEREVERLREGFERSAIRLSERRENAPRRTYDPALPITAHVEQIAAALTDHPAIIVCGETGSGKSTQLPKICLDAGRGIAGFIGHTQPRRIAARSIAARLAEELQTSVGKKVGFKVRFTDATSGETYVKLMTDGVLLAETQNDRFLDQYDTIIVDEAHERTLNVDFLLGYLRRLLMRRPDLRVIVTSATLDAGRFAEHFSSSGKPAPIIEVSGRGYPVSIRYRPLVGRSGEGESAGRDVADDDADVDLPRAIADAAGELASDGPGDMLVFLPTERDIRDVAKVLRGRKVAGLAAEIVPLYARLSAAEQNKVFQPHKGRRIVLATNVAESSLTVPNIRFVIDSGLARISRYSPRSKVQRLPIEPISQASAEQRAGRCGRIGPGICVRLFSEADFAGRDRYPTPEIRRTNLAAVILQMLSLKLGSIHEFPFLDPPRHDAVRDGFKTLFELGAIDEHHRLTDVGRRLGSLPVDPRIGRMVLQAETESCLDDVLIVAAALEVQDPRERPVDRQQTADERHAQWQDAASDFVTYLNLWDWFHDLKRRLSRSQLQKACKQNFLSMNRMREWMDVHRQLVRLVEQSTPRRDGEARRAKHPPASPASSSREPRDATADPSNGQPGLDDSAAVARPRDHDAIHRSLLSGLLANVAMRVDRFDYQGAGQMRFQVWPGSSLFKNKPTWLVAAELVETSRRYLRTAAKIDPAWIEPLAGHLVKRSYSEPHWSRRRRTVMARERVSLFGLPVVVDRRVRYGPIDPVAARRLFIQHALVEGLLDVEAAFLQANEALLKGLRDEADRERRSDMFVAEQTLHEFYNERLPEDVYDWGTLRRWLDQAAEQDERRLRMRRRDLLPGLDVEPEDEGVTPGGPSDDELAALQAARFPERYELGNLTVPVEYRFQPGDADDGLTLTVPREAVARLDTDRLDWLVPGLLEEKLVAMIRTLPKPLRRSLVPAPDTAREAARQMPFGHGPFLPTVAQTLSRLAEEPIPQDAFDLEKLPLHLRFNVRVVDAEGNLLARGRDVAALRRELNIQVRRGDDGVVADARWERDGVTAWDFGELPEQVPIQRGAFALPAFPTLIDRGESVSLRLVDNPSLAHRRAWAGVRRLYALAETRELRAHVVWMPQWDEMERWAITLRHPRPLAVQMVDLLADRALGGQELPRSADAFKAACRAANRRLSYAVQEAAGVLPRLFETYHRVRLALDETASPLFADSIADIESQLAGLMPDGFLAETPWAWLQETPRFLDAILVRLDRLKSGGQARDRQGMTELAPHVARCRQRADELAAQNEDDASLADYRWMIEEFRVSLFAQQLGTSIKVSPQRLEKAWNQMK